MASRQERLRIAVEHDEEHVALSTDLLDTRATVAVLTTISRSPTPS
jgi:hypothetical protein